MSTVDVRYKLANVDDMSQYEIIASSGTGVDPQDKGVGKAMTYSFKYALLRTFMIPTGADPDDIHNEDLEKAQTKVTSQPVSAPIPAPPAEQLVQYMTAEQSDKIHELLRYQVITDAERTKVFEGFPKLTFDTAVSTIKVLTKWITDRTGGAA
jgi:hypothetical protein